MCFIHARNSTCMIKKSHITFYFAYRTKELQQIKSTCKLIGWMKSKQIYSTRCTLLLLVIDPTKKKSKQKQICFRPMIVIESNNQTQPLFNIQ